MTAEFKQSILAHCLRIAEVDPQYASWAAGNFEAMCPELLRNLKAKVDQEIRRSSSLSAPSAGSTSGSTGAPAPAASSRSARPRLGRSSK